MRNRLPLALLVLGSLLTALPCVAQARSLFVVSDRFPPFAARRGEPRVAISLAQEALWRSKITAHFALQGLDGGLALLKKGHYDAAVAIAKTEEREEFLRFSRPLLESRLVLVARKGKDVSAPRLGAVRGTLALRDKHDYGEAVEGVPGLTTKRFATEAECLQAVLSGQADYLLLDELEVRQLFLMHTSKAQELLQVGPAPLVRRVLYFAVRKDLKDSEQIIADVDEKLLKMIDTGRYNDLIELPWIATDVGSDGSWEYVASAQSIRAGTQDPHVTRDVYQLFLSQPLAPQGSPRYHLEGRSYESWKEVSAVVARLKPPKKPSANSKSQQPPYQLATGLVLEGKLEGATE